MRTGTRIEVQGYDLSGQATWEAASIARARKENLPMPDGYHLVRFADGGKLCVHESRFRITDNRC